MSQAAGNQLPPGVNGIDFGEMLMLFLCDKMVVAARGSREHVTIHFGPYTGEIDVHKTFRTTGGLEKHQRIYAIPRDSLAPLLFDVAPVVMQALMRIVRRLDLDELVAKQIRVVVGLPIRAADLEAVTTIRRRKLVLDQDKVDARTWAPKYLEELYGLEDGQFFTLLSTRQSRDLRIVGHGFALSDTKGKRRLLWLPIDSIRAEVSRIGKVIRRAAARHGRFQEGHVQVS